MKFAKCLWICLLCAGGPVLPFGAALSQPMPPPGGRTVSQDRMRLAQDYERRGSYVQALSIYRDLHRAVPSNQLYYEGVKRNMLRLKRFDELIRVIEAQMAISSNVRYHADLGNVYYQAGRREEAFAAWQEALATFARQKTAYSYVANAMVANRLYDKAIDVYVRGRQFFKKDDLFIFELANIYALRLKFEEATLEYLKHLERYPNQFGYIEGRIVNYTKDPEQATRVARVLAGYLQQHEQNYLVRKMLADLYLRNEKYARALQQFRLLERQPAPLPQLKNSEGRELFFFADKALQAGKFEFAEEAFNMIVLNYPKSAYRSRALFGLAVSKQKRGLATEALRQFEALVQQEPSSSWAQAAQFQIGEIYFSDLFDLDSAERAYRDLIRKFPRSRDLHRAYFRVGDCIAEKGDLAAAVNWYRRSLSLVRAGSARVNEGKFKIAYFQFLQGEYDDALKTLGEITDKLGDNGVDQAFANDALELIFLIEENRGGKDEALRLYSSAEKYELTKNHADAIRALSDLLSKYPDSELRDEAEKRLGEIETLRGNFRLALGHFETLVVQLPDSPYAPYVEKRIAEIYETSLAEPQKAAAAYEKILVAYPQSIYVEEARARLRELESRTLNN